MWKFRNGEKVKNKETGEIFIVFRKPRIQILYEPYLPQLSGIWDLYDLYSLDSKFDSRFLKEYVENNFTVANNILMETE